MNVQFKYYAKNDEFLFSKTVNVSGFRQAREFASSEIKFNNQYEKIKIFYDDKEVVTTYED